MPKLKRLVRSPKAQLQALGERVTDQTAPLMPSVRVELLQNRQAVVDGCKGILEYSDTCIRLSADRLILRFTGTCLEIRAFNDTSAIVEGRITGVELM